MTAASAGELTADWLTVDTSDGPMRVYRVEPRPEDAAAPHTAVVVLQEAFGVNDHIQDVARRFAAQGYLAVAPDLFHRFGIQTVDYTDRDTAMTLIGELGPDSIIEDVSAVLTCLADAAEIPVGRTAIVGFCFGGRAAFTAATALPVGATVVFYGPGIVRGPHAVLDRTANIAGPVLMLIGDADPTIPADDIAAIQSAAERPDTDLRIITFAGARHAFHCDARPNAYVADAARQAWLDTTEFLAKCLQGNSGEGS
jgi:carboxymethylenebutenolidase